MKFRAKATCCMIILMALFFGAGGSALVSIPFHTSLRQEKAAAQDSYRMILNTLQIVNSMDEWDDEKIFPKYWNSSLRRTRSARRCSCIPKKKCCILKALPRHF